MVFVQLPDGGAELTSGDTFGEVESTKSVSDLFAPITAKVVAVNGDLEASPDLVNSDPYVRGPPAGTPGRPRVAGGGTCAAYSTRMRYRATVTE